MKRTHPLIASGVVVLFGLAAVFIPGSTLVTAGTERPATDSILQASTETPEATGRDAAVAAIKKVGGRFTFDEQSHITKLDLSRTQITDAGLEYVKGMTELAELDVYETVVGDAGLEHLKGLARLKFLMAKRTNVTDDGADKLQHALPNCQIVHSPLHPPQNARIGILVGRWSVEFSNGVKQTCEIRADDTASVVEPGRASGGKVGIQNRAIIIAYDDDRVERWTLVGKRLVVEHWAPVPAAQRWEGHAPLRPLPTSTPVLGIADRAP